MFPKASSGGLDGTSADCSKAVGQLWDPGLLYLLYSYILLSKLDYKARSPADAKLSTYHVVNMETVRAPHVDFGSF